MPLYGRPARGTCAVLRLIGVAPPRDFLALLHGSLKLLAVQPDLCGVVKRLVGSLKDRLAADHLPLCKRSRPWQAWPEPALQRRGRLGARTNRLVFMQDQKQAKTGEQSACQDSLHL